MKVKAQCLNLPTGLRFFNVKFFHSKMRSWWKKPIIAIQQESLCLSVVRRVLSRFIRLTIRMDLATASNDYTT